jgi:type II secretory pathway pseudopilin PulG
MKGKEAGFSYVDTMVGLTILLVGLLALAGTIAASVMRSRQQEQQLLAKQYATSIMESIISARDIDSPGLVNGWDSIGNVGNNLVGGVPKGVFVNGEQALETGAGPDQLIGTTDDDGPAVPGLTREIIITDICDPERPSYNCSPAGANPVMARRVTVKVRYLMNPSGSVNAATAKQLEAVSTILTNY